jgi:hypothetical protein
MRVMKLFTPQQRWLIWLLSACVPLGFVATGFLYYPLLLRSGLLDPNADSIGIPLAKDMYLATVSAPFIAVLTWACLRNYHGEAELLSWNPTRTIRFWASTVIAGLFIAVLIYDTITSLISIFWWPNLIWIPHYLLLAYWVLMLRAAVLSKTN